MNEFDSNLTKNLDDFMESYKIVDLDQIYSNGIEYVPIFRVKQWLEYNNINNLQFKIDKANELIKEYKSNNYTKYYENEIEIDLINNLEDTLKEDK